MRTRPSEGDGYNGPLGVLISCIYSTGNVQSEFSVDADHHSEGVVAL